MPKGRNVPKPKPKPTIDLTFHPTDDTTLLAIVRKFFLFTADATPANAVPFLNLLGDLLETPVDMQAVERVQAHAVPHQRAFITALGDAALYLTLLTAEDPDVFRKVLAGLIGVPIPSTLFPVTPTLAAPRKGRTPTA